MPYQIHVKQPMTQEEFKAAAMRQIFGGVLKNIEWRNSRRMGSPGSPIPI